MTSRSSFIDTLEALPNPRGGAVYAAEAGLADALRAHERRADTALPLLHAAHALREAGWLAAHRFADTLVLVSPLTADDHANEGPVSASFAFALRAFRAAVERRNLRELACSPLLFEHYRSLSAHVAQHAPGFNVAVEDLALVGRPVAPVTLQAQPVERLTHLRVRYERALLPVLRARGGSGPALADVRPALDELDACIAELASPDPYDFWRLAAACAHSLRVSGHLSGDLDARRFYARCNLALAEHMRGIPLAPRSFVKATVALLWRDYALFGAAAEDTDHVDLLRDYGLTVAWHVAGTQASEALWEAGAVQAGAVQAGAVQAGAVQAEAAAPHAGATRALGALTVQSYAYEDFLQTADASITALREHALSADNPQKADPGAALQAGDAAYRLGAAACALGLGHVALLSDALGLAWRRRAHASVSTPAVRAHVVIDAPDARALEHASESLRAMLHKIAAGVAPPQSTSALASLTRAIEQGSN